MRKSDNIFLKHYNKFNYYKYHLNKVTKPSGRKKESNWASLVDYTYFFSLIVSRTSLLFTIWKDRNIFLKWTWSVVQLYFCKWITIYVYLGEFGVLLYILLISRSLYTGLSVIYNHQFYEFSIVYDWFYYILLQCRVVLQY